MNQDAIDERYGHVLSILTALTDATGWPKPAEVCLPLNDDVAGSVSFNGRKVLSAGYPEVQARKLLHDFYWGQADKLGDNDRENFKAAYLALGGDLDDIEKRPGSGETDYERANRLEQELVGMTHRAQYVERMMRKPIPPAGMDSFEFARAVIKATGNPTGEVRARLAAEMQLSLLIEAARRAVVADRAFGHGPKGKGTGLALFNARQDAMTALALVVEKVTA